MFLNLPTLLRHMVSIYFETLGCSINVSETESMKGLLAKYDFKIVEAPEDAFVIVVNICTVKGDNTALKTIRKLYEEFPDRKYIVAGCITKTIIQDIKKIIPEPSFISTHNIKEIVSVVEETINDNPISVIERSSDEKIGLPRIRKNPIIGIVPISSGCLGCCTYCSVRLIKGKLRSYSIQNITDEIKKDVQEGCKEIWLTSQDTGSYGKDIGTNLVNLLDEIVKIEGNFMIRVGMMNPNHALEMLDDLIKIYKNKKIFKFLHIPVQTGNNDILKLMKRDYGVEDFIKIVDGFRRNFERITIATDIIVGFPGETKEQLNDSVKLIEKTTPDVVNIARFNPRPGTEAAEIKQTLTGDELKDRTRLITQIFEWTAHNLNNKWIKWEGKVLIDAEGKEETSVGRNFAYKPIIVEGIYPVGTELNVKIIDSTKHYLIGEKIN